MNRPPRTETIRDQTIHTAQAPIATALPPHSFKHRPASGSSNDSSSQVLQSLTDGERTLRGFELFEQRLALSASPGSAVVQELWEVFAEVCRPNELPPNAQIHSPASLSDLQNGLLFQPGVIQSSGSIGSPVDPSHPTVLSSSPTASPTNNGLRSDGLHSGLHTDSLLSQAEVIREDYQWSGRGQTVAIIDSGVAWDHRALGSGYGPGNRVVGGWDFAENDANPYDDGPIGYHGTHVTGLIAGDSETLQGVAPGADVVALRVFDDFGRGSLDWIESALKWVYDHRESFESPITTVNLSLGTNVPERLLSTVYAQFEDEFQLLHESNIFVVAAAGNRFTSSDPETVAYPASSQWVVAVGSNRSSGDLSSFSQRYDGILTTVGEHLQSAIPEHVLGWDGIVNDYQAASGTSMAAPQVAGAAMVLREAADSLGIEFGPNDILNLLYETSLPQIDPVTGFEYHPVNLIGAIESLLTSVSLDPKDTPNDPLNNPSHPVHDARSTRDLGTLTWGTTTLSLDTETWVTAERTGLFSFSRIDDGATPIPLQVRDVNGKLLWDGNLSQETQIDLTAQTGESFVFTTNTAQAIEIQLANILSYDRENLSMTLGDHSIPVEVSLSDGLKISVGNFHYDLSRETITTALLDGGVGADHLEIQGSAGAGRLILNPYEDGSWVEAGIDFVLRGFEQVTYDGNGGNDRAFIYDTQGDDRLTASPGSAILEGVGFRYEVTNVARSFVHATAGGQDVAFLYDSPSDDRLAVRPQFVSLRGGDFFNNALGFERVYAYATSGGYDVADIYDSAGDDRLTASSASAMISGPGYYVQARAFDSVTAHAVAGGNDLATLYADSSTEQRWLRTDDQITLRSDGIGDRTARGFERIEMYSAGRLIEPRPMEVSASLIERDTLLRTFYERLHEKERVAMNAIFADLDPDTT